MLSPNQNEAMDRLKLIEAMMTEGRRSTQRWGWSFLLWGIGPLVAMYWTSHLGNSALAWPVTIFLCVIANGLVLKIRRQRGESKTAVTRSLSAVWTCTGTTVLLLSFGAALTGMQNPRMIYAALFALAAAAQGASSLILRWWPQFLAALVWWVACAIAFVVPAARLQDLAMTALLLANVVFGAWLAYREWSRKDG